MAKVEVSRVTYSNYGECLKITNGEKELIATLERGPYIVRYAYVDQFRASHRCHPGSAVLDRAQRWRTPLPLHHDWYGL